MTPSEFKEARNSLNLSAADLARLFQIGSGRTIRRWEDGKQEVPGPVQVLMEWYAWGKKPKLEFRKRTSN